VDDENEVTLSAATDTLGRSDAAPPHPSEAVEPIRSAEPVESTRAEHSDGERGLDALTDVAARALRELATVRTLEWIVIAAPIALIAVLGVTHRWTYEDAYVYFRVVDQVFNGNGPVFNAGERVEAVLSPLWLVTLVIGEFLSPSRLEYTAAFLSLASTVVGCVLGVLASRRLTSVGASSDRFRLPIGLVVLASLWPVWVWSTGGMETGITLCWLGACAFLLSRWATRPGASMPTHALVVFGLGWLVRPDLLVSSLLFVGVAAFGAPASTARRWRTLLIAAAVPVGYQIFRMGYYGLVLSSASVAREDTLPRPGFGWDYLTDFVAPYYLAVPLVAIAIGFYVPFVRLAVRAGDHRRLAVVLAIAGSGIVHAALVIVVGGGDSVHARLLIPAVFAMLLPIFVVPAERAYAEVITVTAIWAVACAPLMRPPGSDVARPFTNGYPGGGLTVADAGYPTRGLQGWMDGPGFYTVDPFAVTGLRTPIELSDPDLVVVAAEAAGALGYALGPDVFVVDLHGAGDPLTGHQRIENRLTPGREKLAYTPWIVAAMARSPASVHAGDFVLVPPFGEAPRELEFDSEVQWADAALDCGQLAELRASYAERLTAGRFFSNLWDAMSNTSLRLDRLPSRAYDEQDCGSGVPATVAEMYRDIAVSDVLPNTAQRGDLVVHPDCATVFVASGDAGDPWQLVEAQRLTATVSMDPDSAAGSFAAVFELQPFGTDTAVVWVSTDGAGNYRVRQELNWIPPVELPWTPIDGADPVEIEIVPDGIGRQWLTTVNGVTLASLPMISGPTAGGNDHVVSVASAADPGSDTPVIEHRSSPPSRYCEAVLDEHRDRATE
jgi:arabinofuranosyltransferase